MTLCQLLLTCLGHMSILGQDHPLCAAESIQSMAEQTSRLAQLREQLQLGRAASVSVHIRATLCLTGSGAPHTIKKSLFTDVVYMCTCIILASCAAASTAWSFLPVRRSSNLESC